MSQSKIESTTNYSRFKFIVGNREINTGRVRKLVRSIKRKNMLQQFPIVCMKNSTGLYIMDGQHRYTAAKELKLPIFFIEANLLTVEDMMHSNGNQKGWLSMDFVRSFAAQGNPDYIKLRDFINEHGIPVMSAAMILSGTASTGGGNVSGTVSLATGKFKAVNIEFASRVASAVRACAAVFIGAKDRPFVTALIRLMRLKDFSISRFIQKLEGQKTKLVKCANWEQYVALIEEIYNHRVRASEIAALSIEVKRALAKQ